MLTRATSYDEIRRAFQWQIPARFNMATAVCERHARDTPDRPALIVHQDHGHPQIISFGHLDRLSNRLANLFVARGLIRGDRVGILLPQTPETAIAHIAAYKAGLIAIPLSTLFRADALEFRLANSAARALVTDRAGLATLAEIRTGLADLSVVLLADGPGDGADDLHAEMQRASDRFATVDTAADDPAFISFTSGTTGPPKGALHAHRSLAWSSAGRAIST